MTTRRTGSVLDIPFILVSVLSLTITVFVSYKTLSEVKAATTASQINQAVLQKGLDALTVFDGGIVFVTGASFLVSILFSSRIRSNPIFAIPSFFFLAIASFLSAEYANIFWLFANTGPMTSVTNTFGFTTNLFQQLPLVVAALGTLIIVALYFNSRSSVAEVTA